MLKYLKVPLFLLVILTLSACVFDIFRATGGYNSQIVSIQTLSLFNQRLASRLESENWKGDWIFRRDRLELIDKELKSAKPDLVLFQEMMQKIGSPSESDQAILSAGALVDHEWRVADVKRYDDTYEIQEMAIAAGLTLKLKESKQDARNFWLLGSDGYLQVAEVELAGDILVVFNVHMPSVIDNKFIWYTFVRKRIIERLQLVNTCRKRVVIGGYLPGDGGSIRFRELLDSLELVDSSSGFCQIASNCYTSTPSNDIFMSTVGDASPSRTDKIFVHKSALIYTSGKTFFQPDTNNRYARQFGLNKLWPTQRFGWSISTKFAKCSESDLNGPVALDIVNQDQ